MSKLYLKASADDRKVFTKTANKKLHFEVYWGSKNDSKLAVDMEITWPKNQLLPLIKMRRPDSIPLEMK